MTSQCYLALFLGREGAVDLFRAVWFSSICEQGMYVFESIYNHGHTQTATTVYLSLLNTY